MKLRHKTLLLTTLPLLGLMAILYGSFSVILQRSYGRFEQQDAHRNLQRVDEVLAGDLAQIQSLTEDWAAWNDTYAFIQNGNPDYLESNLSKYAFERLQLNVVAFINPDGEIVYGTGFDVDNRTFLPLPSNLTQQLNPTSPLMQFEHLASHHQGLMMVDGHLMLVVVEPILRSDATGPSRGALLMGRTLSASVVESLAQRTRLDLQLHPLGQGELSESLRPILTTLSDRTDSATLVRPQNDDTLMGYTLWPDVYGTPQALLEVKLPRDIHRQGLISRHYLGWSLLGSCLVFTSGMLLLLDRVILRRLLGLSQQVQHIGRSNDLTQRVSVQGTDELNHLGCQINDMLSELQISNQKLAQEQQKAEQLLLNILPAPIAGELMQTKVSVPQHFDEVTILFADIVGFTSLSHHLSPIKLVDLLNQIFSAFDSLAEQLDLEKIKTIGDAYMVAAGLPTPRADHAEAIAEMALAMQQVTASFQAESGEPLEIRIGINTGVAVAGVIGTKKFIYDLWGDAVNVASRMETSSEPGQIQVTAATYERLKDSYRFERRGCIAIKGRGEMETYWLRGHRPEALFCALRRESIQPTAP
ncbi:MULTISPECIES: adenylate/guanylate cyclase domain-containing protein [Cyanophyceae]|uniref:adenylate/guanylate cyclase domain-containing protein n=1 Tax=Cyanophyceae TaxID=3028117 RepID=UPI001686CB39|nr:MULTISPECIES: adenylate/guanylate cyclase domain-containing protein [Cyanophyceae]MBD1915400.1 HAMP domain-containing protein [Phormidium sp. FACHB-77]MBD2032401.1 HAMP domain-containing protein [Phormidium sp. FACHB-322]MBD2052572.1 HAMP domain-containing protein [Leptolyngbya sp. FACHB-60]